MPMTIFATRLISAAFGAAFLSTFCIGQNYTVATLAGSTAQVNLAPSSGSLGAPYGIASDAKGNIYFSSQNTVLRQDASTGLLALVAGNGTVGYSGDNGPAAQAQLSEPSGVAVDAAGNVYIADTNNFCIRKVSNGIITTFAGTPGVQFGSSNGDGGPATKAIMSTPHGIALDSSGDLYIADTNYDSIRKVSNGIITTVAGVGGIGFSGDSGSATQAALCQPYGVAVDSAGNLYIADTQNNRIRKVSNGVITTIAGIGSSSSCASLYPAPVGDQLNAPFGVAVDAAGNVYIADTLNARVRELPVGGSILTWAGTGTAGSNGDNGLASSAQVTLPVAVAFDAAGNGYIADYGNSRIRKITSGIITTVAGSLQVSFDGDNGPASLSQLSTPSGLAADAAGNVYIADTANYRVRMVSSTGVITTVVGRGLPPFGVNFNESGPGGSISLGAQTGVAVDSVGNVYVSDSWHGRILKLSGGNVTRIAGLGDTYMTGDNGPALLAGLVNPTGLAVDSAGNIYIADTGSCRIRKVSTAGIITTVVSNSTSDGQFCGSFAFKKIYYPTGIAVAPNGDLYIANLNSSTVLKYSGGQLTIFAGGGNAYTENQGDGGAATSAYLSGPSQVALDSAGSLYITDTNTNRIRKVTNGIITTIAGATLGFGGDGGPATGAAFNSPWGVAVDGSGKVYVADTFNARVRMLTPSATAGSCSYSISPPSAQLTSAGGNVTVAIQAGASCAWTVTGFPNWITTASATSGTGPATIGLTVAPTASASSRSWSVDIAGAYFAVSESADPTAVIPTITAVTNAASFKSGIVPGSIVTIFGIGLGAQPGQVITNPAPWPTQIGGTTVTIGGIATPAYSLVNLNGQEQLSVQVPWSIQSSFPTTLFVTTPAGTSPALTFTFPVSNWEPGIFLLDSVSSGATHLNGTVAGASNPASTGEAVVLYLTGLGAVSNTPPTGSPASLTTLSTTVVTPQVTIGGIAAPVSFSGLAPGFIGLYQINTTVPQNAPSGLLDLVVTAQGTPSNTAKIAVH
jgi:uncharacterized protein (TIGR03437 family)